MNNKSIKGFIIVILGLIIGVNNGLSQDSRIITPNCRTNMVSHFCTTTDYKYVRSPDSSNEFVVWDNASIKQITSLSVTGAVSAISEPIKILLIVLKNGSVLKFEPNHFRLSSLFTYSNSIVDLITHNDNVIMLTNSGEATKAIYLSP